MAEHEDLDLREPLDRGVYRMRVAREHEDTPTATLRQLSGAGSYATRDQCAMRLADQRILQIVGPDWCSVRSS
jgi:hypothetical protein